MSDVALAQDAGGRSAALPYYNRANRYLNQSRYEDAERDLLEAIRLYPDEPDFHTNLGIAYRKLNRFADAEKEFKIAIAYNRDDWQNWSNLANAYLKQDMLEKTIATFEETLKHKPPASEQAAIKQDITDIKKVLASRQPPAPAGSEGKKSGSGKTSANAKSSTQSATKKRPTGGEGQADVARSSNISGTPAAPAEIKQTKSNWGYNDSKSN